MKDLFRRLEDLGDVSILGEASEKHALQRRSGSQPWQHRDVSCKRSRQARTRPEADVSFIPFSFNSQKKQLSFENKDTSYIGV